MRGGTGHDYMEGNHGSDWMFGNEDEDDLIGGNSAGNGIIGGAVGPKNLKDGHDIMNGDEDDDVMLSDNGTIKRAELSGQWQRINGAGYNMVVRQTTMEKTAEVAAAFGNDFVLGGSGEDDMYGQGGNDYMEGNAGEDAMVGDLGLITNRLEDGSRTRTVQPQQPFLKDTIFTKDSLTRITELHATRSRDGAKTVTGAFGGDDTMLGGDGNDSMHGGFGKDVMNGDGDSIVSNNVLTDPNTATSDEDRLFGGDSDDVIWGGRGHDHLYGGYGADHLDVKPRAMQGFAADPASWFTYGRVDNYAAIDYMYGGWDQDAMQANIGDAGPVPGDRLIDWVGAYNAYYLCPGLYGDYVATRALDPGMVEFLQALAEGDGALSPALNTSSGFQEVGMVFNNQAKSNSSPIHPDTPGHFTCSQ
jgi:Ca2+-binding RTX toxin-like protein